MRYNKYDLYVLQDLTARKELQNVQIKNVGEEVNKLVKEVVALNDKFITSFVERQKQ